MDKQIVLHPQDGLLLGHKKEWTIGSSLAVQWLRLYVSNAGGVGWSPDEGSKIPHVQPPPQKKEWTIDICSNIGKSRNITVSYAKWGLPGSSVGKESTCNAGDPGSIPAWGRSPGDGVGCPLQCSCASLVTQLEKNPTAVRETWIGLKLSIQKMKIMASGPIISWQIDGEAVMDFIFLGSKITAAMKLKDALWKKSYDQPRQHIRKQRCYFANKGPSSQSCGFSSSHVWMWELDYKESWAPKNWCFWSVVLIENPLDSTEIKPVNLKSDLNTHWKDWCWSWNSNTLATWCEEQTHWKRPWCWERLKTGEGDDRGWDGWMASPTWWVWLNSGSWWWTGKLQSMGLQRVGHNWGTEMNSS